MRPELIQASDLLRRNTPEAVDEAIGLLQNTVYSFSMKVCGHPEDAEDTMQEVLYRSLGHLAKIQDPQALAVWLYTVTRNRCWRMRRKGASAPKHILSLDELMPDEAELGRLLQDAAAGPEGQSAARRTAPPAAPGGPANSRTTTHSSRAARHGGVDHRTGRAGPRPANWDGPGSPPPGAPCHTQGDEQNAGRRTQSAGEQQASP